MFDHLLFLFNNFFTITQDPSKHMTSKVSNLLRTYKYLMLKYETKTHL